MRRSRHSRLWFSDPVGPGARPIAKQGIDCAALDVTAEKLNAQGLSYAKLSYNQTAVIRLWRVDAQHESAADRVTMMHDQAQKAKRLAPKGETLRELFLKSGNLCAFPGCGALMMDADGVFIGQVCHIEAAAEDGERFNAKMSNESRRRAENLMLMCYTHHQKTNDVKAFTVAKLAKMKSDHEKRFSHPDRAILEKLTDWTEGDAPSQVANLIRMDKALGWNNAPEELINAAAELNDYIARLRNVPIELRGFVGAVAKRAVKMAHSRVVQTSMFGTNVLISDLKGAFRLGERAIGERANQLDAYGIGDVDSIETDFGPKPAVRIRNFKSGWPFWTDLVLFCENENEPIEAFTEDMDFQRLDE